jgi:hypothetical protein
MSPLGGHVSALAATPCGNSPTQRIIYSERGRHSAAQEIETMQIRKTGTLFLAGILTLGMSSTFALSQDGAKQDMKSAGHETKDAAKDTGHGISTGTKKAYHKTSEGTQTAYGKTKHGTKKAYHKTANGTKHTVHKVEGKPADAPQ